MNVKKIAVLTEAINNHSGSRAPLEIAKNLKRLGYEITIISYSNSLDQIIKSELQKLEIEVLVFAKFKNPIANRILPDIRIVKVLRKGNFDLSLAAAFLPAILAAKIVNVPILKIYMGTQFNAYLEKFNPDEKIGLFDRLINIFSNTIIYSLEFTSIWISNYVIAISNFCSKELQKIYFKKSDSVIYLGGNHLSTIHQLPTTSIPSETSAQEGHKLPISLLSISRITPYKNFHLLIDALKSLKAKKGVYLTITGPGVNQKYLNYLKSMASINIKFVINPSDDELAQLYYNCDIYISADRYLFFGLPIAEAAFFKKPSIVYNFAAAKELVINKKTGFVVNNQSQMQQAIETLIKNPRLVNNLGQNAFERSQKLFTWKKTAQDFQKFFEKLP